VYSITQFIKNNFIVQSGTEEQHKFVIASLQKL